MHDFSWKDFFRFFLGFVGMVSLGFVALVVIGIYQIEIVGTNFFP